MLFGMAMCRGLFGGLAGLSLLAMAGAASAGIYLHVNTGARPESAGAPAGTAEAALFGLHWYGPAASLGTDEPAFEMVLYLFDPDGRAVAPSDDLWASFYFHSLSAGNFHVAMGGYSGRPLLAGSEILASPSQGAP